MFLFDPARYCAKLYVRIHVHKLPITRLTTSYIAYGCSLHVNMLYLFWGNQLEDIFMSLILVFITSTCDLGNKSYTGERIC
jgi:hypothetical protein